MVNQGEVNALIDPIHSESSVVIVDAGFFILIWYLAVKA
jgi:hypothetical protein